MEEVKYIILHCAATEAGKDFTINDIDTWHRHRGFNGVGYHYVIHLDGSVHQGRPLDRIGAHCLGYNRNSIGICYIGGLRNGLPCDTRTQAQDDSLARLVTELLEIYPKAQVCGHCDLNPHKACPCFDVREWARQLGIAPQNIL